MVDYAPGNPEQSLTDIMQKIKNDPNNPLYLAQLAAYFQRLYQRDGNQNDFDMAIVSYRQALELASEDHPGRPAWLGNLGNAYLSLSFHENTGDPKALEQAINYYKQALELTPEGHPHRPALLGGLGTAHVRLYERTGDPKTLEQAINYYKQALELTPEDHPDRSAWLHNLGNANFALYRLAHKQKTLEQAINHYRKALDLAPQNYTGRPNILSDLGAALRNLYYYVDNQNSLDQAITALNQALELTPENHPDRPFILNELGAARHALYKRTGSQKTLEQAINHYRKALDLVPQSYSGRPVMLNNLGNALLSLYKHTGDLKTLDQAITALNQALELTPENHPDRPGLLSNLGAARYALYEHTGDLKTLDQAIARLHQVLEVRLKGRSRSPWLPFALNNLSASLLSLYKHTGDLKTLDQAITALNQALELTPENHPDRPNWLNNLGNARFAFYRRTGNQKALEQAIARYEQALKLAPESHPDRPSWLNNLGNARLAFYRRTGNQKALEQAIARYEQALKLAPESHTDRPDWLGNLGVARLAWYELTNVRIAVVEAITALSKAIELAPESHPNRPSWLNNLGNAHRILYQLNSDPRTLEKAIANYRKALKLGTDLNPGVALLAGRNWINFSFTEGKWSELEEAYRLTLSALERHIAYQTDRSDLAHTLSNFQALPALAAWAQIELGDYREAVTALESGRTFVLREALERGRRDLERLPALGYRDLYERFEEAKQRLQRLERISSKRRPQNWLSQMSEARSELERVAGEIRGKVKEKHPEYRFLMSPLPFSEIRNLAANTPLVYLFATPKGGRALVVRKEGDPQVVRLPRLTERGLLWVFRGKGDEPGSAPDPESYYGAYDGWREEDSPEKRKAWFDAIESALDFLGEALAPLREFLDLRGYNRVTLIPAGILAALPLHAARFKDGEKETYFLEHHTFAYAPSAHALYYAIKAGEKSRPEPLLAVENPNGDLAHAALEVKAIREHFTRVKHFAREEATVEIVKKALLEAGVFHFSGHGAGGWGSEEPRLQLADGKLTLSELLHSGETLDRLRLAVLSACETGLADVRAFDEFLGLPAGFLLAGAPGVVGSLWSVPDVETALLIVRFYEKLCSGKADSGKVDAAEALREAQTWMLRMSPEEKHASLARLDAKLGNSALAGTRMSLEAAEGPSDLIESGGRKVKHPYYWAAFGYYGVPVELERCGNRREG